MRDKWVFLSPENLQAIVGLLTTLISISLCLRDWRGSRKGKETGMTGGWSSQNTYNIYYQILCLIQVHFVALQNKCNSNIKDHWWKSTIINIIIIIMKKLEIIWELPKYDTKTWSEPMLLEKWCWQTCSMQVCCKLSIGKKCKICEAQ